MAHGHLVLSDVACDDVTINVGAGEVRLGGVHADTAVDVGAGHVVAERHTGLFTCDCGTGDARIEVVGAKAGEYTVDVGIGQAELVLPPGLRVHPSLSSGLGKSELNYPDAGDGAEITARVNAGIGRAALTMGKGPGAPHETPASRKPPASRRTESEEVRVLQLLEQGRISAQEAADLITALQGAPRPSDDNDFD
jgi:hypothetical protein